MDSNVRLPDGTIWPLVDSVVYIDQVPVPFGGTREGRMRSLSRDSREVLITAILLMPPSPELVTATDLGSIEFLVEGCLKFRASVAGLMNRYRGMTARVGVDHETDLSSLSLACPIRLEGGDGFRYSHSYSLRHVGVQSVRSVDETLPIALDLLQEKGLMVDVAALRPLLRPSTLTVEFQAMGRGARGPSPGALDWEPLASLP